MSRKNVLLLGFIVCLAACESDGLGIVTPRSNQAVIFDAATAYENNIPTKTVYSDTYYLNGTESEFATAQVERINWLATDKIDVLSPQALEYDKSTATWTLTQKGQIGSVHYASATYDISPSAVEGEKHHAGATIADSTDGLQWDAGFDGSYKFYAYYPSSGVSNGKDKPVVTLEAISDEGVATYKVTGSSHVAGIYGIPVEQGGIETNGVWTDWGEWKVTQTGTHSRREYLPNMNFAAMAAFSVGSRGNAVSLAFRPVVTALRVELLAHEHDDVYNQELEAVILNSEYKTLTGDYRFSIGGSSAGAQTPGSFAIVEHAGDQIKINLSHKQTKLSLTDTTVVTFLCAPVDQTHLSLTLAFANGETRTLELKDANKDWISLTACKKSYLSKIPVHKEYEFSVSLYHVDNADPENQVRDVVFPSSGGSFSDCMRVVSYARDGNNTAKGWQIAGYFVNGNYTSGTDGLDAWFGASGITNSGTGGKDTTKFNVEMTANSHGALSPSDWTRVGGDSQVNAVDLSYRDIEGNSRTQRITANCYVVQGTGWYKIPLVYGNAINSLKALDGNNFRAYQSNASDNHLLQRFLNHNGDQINAPWITSGPSGQQLGGMGINVDGAKVLWQDSENLIATAKIGEADNDKHYLYIYLGDDIKEGNAMVAATSGGTVVWSWHIWVVHMPTSGRDFNTQEVEAIPTNDPVSDPGSVSATQYRPASKIGTAGMNTWKTAWRYQGPFYNRSDIKNDMLNVNLGYSPGPQNTAEPRAIVVRFVQDDSGLHQDVTFAQRGDLAGASCVYYQWGRKDPLFPSRYVEISVSEKYVRNAVLWDGEHNKIVDGTLDLYKESLPADCVTTGGSIVNAIQHPDLFYSDVANVYYNQWNTNVESLDQIGNQNYDETRRDLEVEKTVYDPCPPGFKVPNEFAFAGFNSTGGDIVLSKSDGSSSGGYYSGVYPSGAYTNVDDPINVRNAKYNEDRGYRFRIRPYMQNSQQILLRAYGHRTITGQLADYPTNTDKSGVGYYWTSAPRLHVDNGGNPETLYGGSFVFSYNRVRSVVGSPALPSHSNGWPTGVSRGFPEGFTPVNAFTIRPVVDR